MDNTPQQSKLAKALTTREIMASVALGFTVLGSAVMTMFATWIIWIVWKGGWGIDTAQQRISILSKALVISLGGSLIVLITLGFVISRRTIKVTKDGFAMSSDAAGDDSTTDGDSATKTVESVSTTEVRE
jgi:hypothetical protein